MYLPDEEVEKTVLRQGDIIGNVHILGALNLKGIQYQYPGLDTKEPVAWTVPTKPVFGPAAVLSHSCELDPENSIKVTSIILAPLRDLNSATPPEKVQELIDSNLIDAANPAASFLKYFYLEAHRTLPFQAGCVADYSKCFSLRNQSYDLLLQSKVAQLNNRIATSFALKLALYFHREQQPTATRAAS